MNKNVFVTYHAQERRGDMFYQGIIGSVTMIIDRPIDCTEVVRSMEKKIKEECVKDGAITEHGNVVVTNWRRFEESDPEGSQGSQMGSQGSESEDKNG